MDYFVCDFETYYASKEGYTLRKMTVEEYINDPRFHAYGFSIKKNGGKSHWVPEEKIEFMLRQLKLHEHAVIAHNAPFDMAILNWKYGVKPKLIIDTLAMARGTLGNEERLALEALGERFGIGKKGDAVLHMDGVRHPSAHQLKKLGEYACNDADMEWELYLKLKEGFPRIEQVVIDITTRMFSEPSLVLDPVPIRRELEIGKKRKEELLLNANCTMEDLRSDAKFAELLEGLGVIPPKKLSEKKSKKEGRPVYTWAFAKSDPDFKALAEHEDEAVRWSVEARLGLKSTIKQSRAERFLGIQQRMGLLPVSLVYYGAGTGRYAAGGSINCQNLPALRGSKDPDAGLLRKSMVAPKGKVVIVSDASQIEARILAWQAGQDDVVEAFAQGRDVYAEMASQVFHRPIDKDRDWMERFIGKALRLGCGYQLGHTKFAAMINAGMLGGPKVLFDEKMVEALDVHVNEYAQYVTRYTDVQERLIELKPAAMDSAVWLTHAACAKKIIDIFRNTNRGIVEYWKKCGDMIEAMYAGEEMQVGVIKTGKNFLVLPNGMKLHFKELEKKDGEFSCLRKKEGRVQRVKVYPGSVAENITQALAGVYVKEAMARAYLKGYRPVLQVHDEVVVLADEDDAEEALGVVNACMETAPVWAVGLPLAASGDFARSYGHAK